MKNKQYDEALQLLKTVIIQEKGIKKVVSLLRKIRCEIDSDRKDDALTTWKEAFPLITSKEFENESKKTRQECYDELQSTTEKFISINRLDIALELLDMRFTLAKQLFSGDKQKLRKLSYLGIPIRTITNRLDRKSQENEVQLCYSLLDKILEQMQTTENVELKQKARQIAWLMNHYGACCNYSKDFNKSIEVHSKAIFHLKSVFGDNVYNHQIYGILLQGYAVSLQNISRLTEAKQVSEEALKSYELTKNWKSDEQKMDLVLLTTDVLNKITEKLES